MKTLATVAIMAVLASGCSAGASTSSVADTSSSSTTVAVTSTTTSTSTTTTTAPVTTTTLRPIDADYVWVNGARLVYRCAGDGPISVLVENGLAGDSNHPLPINFMGWQDVVDGVSERVRVCVYNRRGVGGSDNNRQGVSLRTTQTQVDDLVVLVEELGLSKPFVIVGHSIAGFNIRLLADQHPDLVAGAVFVDASHPGQLLALGIPVPAGPVEWLDFGTSVLQVMDKGDMGDKPLVVLAGALFKDPPSKRDIWLGLQKDTATLSTNSRYILVEDAGHYVMGSHPDIVIDAIHWILDEIEAAG